MCTTRWWDLADREREIPHGRTNSASIDLFTSTSPFSTGSLLFISSISHTHAHTRLTHKTHSIMNEMKRGRRTNKKKKRWWQFDKRLVWTEIDKQGHQLKRFNTIRWTPPVGPAVVCVPIESFKKAITTTRPIENSMKRAWEAIPNSLAPKK